ncbi:protein inturned isoform X2 [Sorex araneus]|uniref:protein inturned isoform X2 n=1 Tax=Sorex araneus TaxID=42254 RepID=UPI002433B9EF|nr:protein inturned isoform X2 [Sorex araneus]
MAASAPRPSPPRSPEPPGEEDDDASDLGASDSASCTSGSDDDLEPEWLHSVQRRGDLFYLELDEADEGGAAVPGGRAVRFSEAEVVISEGEGAPRGPPGLRRLARALRGRRLLPRRARAPPVSILKASPAARALPASKEVTLHVHPRAPMRRPLEALLGIVHRGRRRPAPLQVHGLLPGGPALGSGQVLIGDILVAVDDVPVTTENIERVLADIPGPTQVKLTFEKALAAKGSAAPPSPRQAPAGPGELVRLLGGDQEGDAQRRALAEPHVAMCLSLQLDSDAAKDEEVLYLFPATDAAQKLKSVRGVFLTLCDMLETVTGTPVTSSSLLLDGRQVHVSYCREGDKLLVLSLPARRAPLPQLRSMAEAAVRTLRFMFGSLESAFAQAENAAHLDHLFALFFQRALQPEAQRCGAVLLDTLPGAHWLPLPQDIKVELDAVLSDLEAADFAELSEDECDMRRLYTIVGTSLFYKGHLLCSHLPRDHLLEVTGYCHHVGLLPLAAKRRVGQLVVWREVFPGRHLQPATDTEADSPREPDGRSFLLVVGLGHCLLSVLLEAGGCASPAVDSPGPDCVYVDQARATLRQLEALEARISQQLAAMPGPALSCADWLLAGPHESATLTPGAARAAASPTCRRTLFGDCSAKTRSSAGAEWADPSPQPTPEAEESGTLPQAPRKKPALLSPFQLGPLKKDPSEKAPGLDSALKLTSGPENTLFHYVALETVQGVFVTPTHEQVAQLGGAVHPQLLRNFHRCCLAIRAVFQQAQAEERRASAGGGPLATAPRSPWPHPVKEHGLLFECPPEDGLHPRKDPPALAYWVVGRRLLQPEPRELYVCFHDSVAEVAVEMAFKLFFALAL